MEYQPEIAAEAILFAAGHPRRKQYWVGASTVATLLAQKLTPAILDRYLARTGYASQQTDGPAAPDRPQNLWRPADGPTGHDFGAHGSFDERALGRSCQRWLSQHPAVTAVATGGAADLAAALGAVRRRTR